MRRNAAAPLLHHTAAQKQAESDSERLPQDKRAWDRKKTDAVTVAGVYAQAEDDCLKKHGLNVDRCSEHLILQTSVNSISGEESRKVLSWKCRERHCPICQSARAVKLSREFEAALPAIMEQAKGKEQTAPPVFLFLTLSVKNCPLTELRASLAEMGKAWKRLIEQKEFEIVRGWIRGTEVTRGAWIDTRTGKQINKRDLHKVPAKYRRLKDSDCAHPHFHVLLLVPPSYFGKYYIKRERWVELWQKAVRLDYTPTGVDIRRVKTAKGGIVEAVKAATYSVKPVELEIDPAWFHEYHWQVSSLRFLATGGVIKAALGGKAGGEADDIAEGKEPDGVLIDEKVFDFNRPKSVYLRRRKREG